MKFFVLSPIELINKFGLKIYLQKLNDYLNEGRQDILSHPLFFEDNVCSHSKGGNFSLFQRVGSIQEADIVIIGLYLELLEYWHERKKMVTMLLWVAKTFYPKKVIAYYNHDSDFAPANEYIPSNVFIINSGYTSNPGKNDILIPFWNIQKNPYSLPKIQFASFIGAVNNNLRHWFVTSILKYNHPDIYHKKVYGDDYLRELSSTKFSLCPRGGRGSGGLSFRIFEVIEAESIPVILVDILHFPMKEIIPWERICIRIPEEKAVDIEYIHTKLKEVDSEKMIEEIKKVKPLLTFKSVQQYVHDSITRVI